MDWVQYSGLILTILGTFGFLYNEIRNGEAKVEKFIQHSTDRTDRLYQMFVDLLKERK